MYYAWALHPREKEKPRGNIHIVTENQLSVGRLHRQPADALCKPAAKFWSLSPVEGSPDPSRLCRRCTEVFDRLAAQSLPV
ncbi:MAG: hypothetical protein ACM3QZ_07045 [Solirubrobacterales bacterium]